MKQPYNCEPKIKKDLELPIEEGDKEVGVEFMIKPYRGRNITKVSTHNACFHQDIVIVSVGIL
jgi:hypothetical protein